MSKVYMVLTDLQLNNRKENRFHYDEECVSVINEIGKIAGACREAGFSEVYGISLGDLCDYGKTNRIEYVRVQQQLKLLLSHFDDFYLTFGNHEITFYKDNPVYSFIHDIQHPEICTKFYFIKCESTFNEIKTPERLILNNAELVFRGWGTTSTPETNKRGIMFLHAPLLSSNGLQELYATNSYNEQPYLLEPLNLSDVFCGHVHTVVEDWELYGIHVHNLGSLLRTSASEISDFNRVRKIPLLLVDDDNNLYDIIYEKITLHERSLIVDEESLKASQEKREEIKITKELVSASKLPNLDIVDPVNYIRDILETKGDNYLINIMTQLDNGQIPLWRRENE